MNLVSFGGLLGDSISEIWITICCSLNWLVYNILELIYRVFIAVANVNLFSKDIFDAFTRRMYIVVGMAMLFIFAYNIILMIINPEDKKGSGQMQKVVKETIISLVLVILLPTIFNYMAVFQKNVLDSQIITKIILGEGVSENKECDYSNVNSIDGAALELACKSYYQLAPSIRGAYLMSPTLLNAFLYPINYSLKTCEDYVMGNGELVGSSGSKDEELCKEFYVSFRMAQYTGSIKDFVKNKKFIKILKKDDNEILNFNYIFSLIGGIIAIVIFVSYSIMVGVRVAKLGFLEIIAPIPVMMRIIPKQKEAFFDKWFKELKNTYFDLFIRVAIINFALFSVSLVPDVVDSLSGGGEDNFAVLYLAKAVVILGILQFAKEAPNLLKEFFGDSGRFSIKTGFDNWKSAGKTVAKPLGMAVGAVGGGAVGAIRNFSKGKGIASGVGGLIGGTLRGAKNGYSGGLLKSGQNISKTADEVEAARERHRATRAKGQINGKEIAGVSSVVGTYRNAKDSLKETASNAKGFVTGTSASSTRGEAAQAIINEMKRMESSFTNSSIEGIKAGQKEVLKNLNADKDFQFNGSKYHKVDQDHWSDENGNKIASDKLKKKITSSYKDRRAIEQGRLEVKPGVKEGYDDATDTLMKVVRDSAPKLGDAFSSALFKQLNDNDGLNLNINSMDELEDRVKDLVKDVYKTVDGEKQLDLDKMAENRAVLYKINDEIKTTANGINTQNAMAEQALQTNKNQKDKK